jgi:hypothetical protein
MDAVLLEFALKGLSDAIKSDIGRQLIVFFFAWWIIKGTISKHFSKIEEGLNSVASNVSSLKDTMASIETNHNTRIVKVENGLEKLNSKVADLAKPKE